MNYPQSILSADLEPQKEYGEDRKTDREDPDKDRRIASLREGERVKPHGGKDDVFGEGNEACVVTITTTAGSLRFPLNTSTPNRQHGTRSP
jgi:hypothetical protein